MSTVSKPTKEALRAFGFMHTCEVIFNMVGYVMFFLAFDFLGWSSMIFFWGQTMIKIQELKLPHKTHAFVDSRHYSLFWTKHNVLKAEHAIV